jgi:hypothetical protein
MMQQWHGKAGVVIRLVERDSRRNQLVVFEKKLPSGVAVVSATVRVVSKPQVT